MLLFLQRMDFPSPSSPLPALIHASQMLSVYNCIYYILYVCSWCLVSKWLLSVFRYLSNSAVILTISGSATIKRLRPSYDWVRPTSPPSPLIVNWSSATFYKVRHLSWKMSAITTNVRFCWLSFYSKSFLLFSMTLVAFQNILGIIQVHTGLCLHH